MEMETTWLRPSTIQIYPWSVENSSRWWPLGSGKSTLLHMLGGLDRPDSGKVFIEGRDIFGLKDEQLAIFRRRKIGFIFQDYNLMPALNVWENIVLPIGLDGKRVNKDYVMSIVKSIGMEDRLTATPSMLSGGQKQRVAIARAIASRPAIILADEPLAIWTPRQRWKSSQSSRTAFPSMGRPWS